MQNRASTRALKGRSVHTAIKQARLLEFLGKAFLLQLRMLSWSELSKRQRRRISTLLRLLASDMQLAEQITAGQPHATSPASPVKATARW